MTTKTRPEETELSELNIKDYAEIPDVDEATWAYLNALEEDGLRDKLFPYVRAAMVSLQRAVVRKVEDNVFGGEGDGPGAERLPVDLLANRLMFTTEAFALSDGTYVEWLKATPAQHLDRAEMQRRLAGKCLVDVERHEQAAKLIKKHKVTCLAEIGS